MYSITHTVTLGQRLTVKEVLEISERLPEPDATYAFGETTFEIYKAKWLYGSRWIDPLFFRLVIEARTTYYRYGELKLFDDYDHKAAIYLVRVRYVVDGDLVEEWFSNRFIPGDGDPPGAGDFELFLHAGECVDVAIKRALSHLGSNVMSHIVTSSRTCGIMPFAHNSKAQRENKALRQRCPALSYALLNRQFFQDCAAFGRTFEYLEGVVRDEFVQKSLTVTRGSHLHAPLFTPVHEVLGLPDGSSVALNRSTDGRYVYQFPAYFLDNEQLTLALKRLVAKGQLTVRTLSRYMQDELLVRELLSDERVNLQKVQGLGKLFTVCGKIEGSSVSGEELRSVLDSEVGDGPGLKLTFINDWIQSIDMMLVGVNDV